MRRSPVLRNLFKTTKSVETNVVFNTESNSNNIRTNKNDASPQYRPRHSYCRTLKTKIISKNKLNR